MAKFVHPPLPAAAPAAAIQYPCWALLPFTKADKQNPVLTLGTGSLLSAHYGTADSKIVVATRQVDR